jgi:glycosyl transferase family 92
MKKICTMLFCFNLWIANAENYRYELALLAIFQDEAPYLKEWIEFHKLVGVQHFYLYNNLSADDYLSVLQPYIDSGEVELIQWPFRANSWDEWIYGIQPAAYTNCIQFAREQTKWLAIIDADEFLTPISSTNIPDILKDYDAFAAVSFNWKIFGHSGLFDLPPQKLLIESLVMTAPLERGTHLGIKSIVKPAYVENCNAHYCICKEGYYNVNSNKEQKIEAIGITDAPHYDRLIVNHYWSRTGSDLYKKLKRYSAWKPEIVPENWPEYVQGMNEVRDHSMDRFIAPLRKQMGFDK